MLARHNFSRKLDYTPSIVCTFPRYWILMNFLKSPVGFGIPACSSTGANDLPKESLGGRIARLLHPAVVKKMEICQQDKIR